MKNLDEMRSLGRIYSNFDHELKEDMIAKLKESFDTFGEHIASYFYGAIWYENEQFHEQIWQFKKPVKEYSNKSVRQLIALVNSDFGYE